MDGLERLGHSISTGAYSYPLVEAAPVALRMVMDCLAAQAEDEIQLVRFLLHGQRAYEVCERVLTRLMARRRYRGLESQKRGEDLCR